MKHLLPGWSMHIHESRSLGSLLFVPLSVYICVCICACMYMQCWRKDRALCILWECCTIELPPAPGVAFGVSSQPDSWLLPETESERGREKPQYHYDLPSKDSTVAEIFYWWHIPVLLIIEGEVIQTSGGNCRGPFWKLITVGIRKHPLDCCFFPFSWPNQNTLLGATLSSPCQAQAVGRLESSVGRLLLLSVEHPVPRTILEGGEGINVCLPSLLLCGFFTLLLLLFTDVVLQLSWKSKEHSVWLTHNGRS